MNQHKAFTSDKENTELLIQMIRGHIEGENYENKFQIISWRHFARLLLTGKISVTLKKRSSGKSLRFPLKIKD